MIFRAASRYTFSWSVTPAPTPGRTFPPGSARGGPSRATRFTLPAHDATKASSRSRRQSDFLRCRPPRSSRRPASRASPPCAPVCTHTFSRYSYQLSPIAPTETLSFVQRARALSKSGGTSLGARVARGGRLTRRAPGFHPKRATFRFWIDAFGERPELHRQRPELGELIHARCPRPRRRLRFARF